MASTHDAANAYEQVLAYAGASLCRDTVDKRYINETRNGTATYKGSVTGKWGRIDLVSDAKGYTEANFGTGSRPTGFDTDKDGIPDDWETANGLDPNQATDARATTLDPAEYYTNIEVYCNSLVQHIMINENKKADDAVADYFPPFYNEDDILVNAVNPPSIEESQDVNVTLSAATNNGDNSSSSYGFNGGYTITNTKSKSYATGNNNGIKYSAGVQYTIVLPEKVSIAKATFTGYDNYTTDDAWLGEVNGVTYESTVYPFPKTREQVSYAITFSPAATGAITFTPMGKQMVLTIGLQGYRANSTGISQLDYTATCHSSVTYYNLRGQQLQRRPASGTCIEVTTTPDGLRRSRIILH